MVARVGTPILLVALLCAGSPVVSRAQQLPETTVSTTVTTPAPPPRSEHRHRRRGPRRFPDEFHSPAGYLFLNGRYVPPPYTLAVRDGHLHINGEATKFQLNHQAVLGESIPDPRGNSFRPRVGLPDKLLSLEANNILVLFDDAEPISLQFTEDGKKFLSALIDFSRRERFLRQSGAQLILAEDMPRWRDWLSAYQPPRELRARAELEIAVLEKELLKIEHRERAFSALSRWNRPLNICGLILVIAAGSHLVFSAPFSMRALRGLPGWSRSGMPLALSLGFVLVLSALDLVWTVLVSQAGMMEEANPLARLFIDDPAQLTAFKSIFTFGAIGIFAVLRQFRPAQVGAWWACFICTLLATRWLVFHTLSV